LIFLPSIWLLVLVVWSHIRSIWPPIRSVMAGAVPLYGTVVMSVLTAVLKHQAAQVRRRAQPRVAQVDLAFVLAIQADSSLKLFAGSEPAC
jgi:hypothetical protein